MSSLLEWRLMEFNVWGICKLHNFIYHFYGFINGVAPVVGDWSSELLQHTPTKEIPVLNNYKLMLYLN